MIFNSQLEWLNRKLAATKCLLDMSQDSPLMKASLESRILDIQEQIANIGVIEPEARLDVRFSGDAIYGSRGISTPFMEKTMHSLVGMIDASTRQKVQLLGEKKKKKIAMPKGQFYITGLTHGSFGFEMTFQENGSFLKDSTTAESIHDVINVLEQASSENLDLDSLIQEQPLRLLSHLRDFMTIIKSNNSTLRMESGSMAVSLDLPHVDQGYQNICKTDFSEKRESIRAIFKGALIESGKFEYTEYDGKTKQGFVSEDILDEQMAELSRQYTLKECTLHVLHHIVSYSNGKKRDYIELEGIDS